mgnify:CR=1 FL=1
MKDNLNELEGLYPSLEIMMWNSVWLIILAISALMVLVNRMDAKDEKSNTCNKVMYGTLCIVALVGVLYPIELGLLGVNIVVSIILLVDYFRYDKIKKKNEQNRTGNI